MDVLDKLPPIVETVWIPWKIFGSCSHINHPYGIVDNFKNRSNTNDKFLGHGKSIFQTKNLVNFGCCGHYVEIKNNSRIHTPNGDYYYTLDMTEEKCSKFNLHLNHYMFLSEEYYLKIKCSRGGGESGLTSKYSIDYFRENDKIHNSIRDDELINKKNIYKSIINKYSLDFINSEDVILFNKYLNKSNNYLQICNNNSEKLLFQCSLKNNLKNIISIESEYDKFNEINEFMKDKKSFIHLFNNNNNDKTNNNNYKTNNIINIINIINNNILKNIDLIYIDINIDENLYRKLLKIIPSKCNIIINNKNNKNYNIFLKNYKIIDKTKNKELLVLYKNNSIFK
jgi:hypothetical protein